VACHPPAQLSWRFALIDERRRARVASPIKFALGNLMVIRMRLALLAFGLSAFAHAQTARLPDPTFLRSLKDDNVSALPRGLTPGERAIRLPRLQYSPSVAPAGTVFTPPEYAPNEGLILSWVNQQTALLTTMATAITTGDPDAKVFIAVTQARRAAAETALANAGAVMSRVKFIVGVTDSIWMRDYGPRFIVSNGKRAIVDHLYNRPRPNDDRFPQLWQAASGDARFELPLEHGGGNFHLFGNREAFMTSLVLTENPTLRAADVRDLYVSYQGQQLDIRDPFPSSFDSTQHIDMWMLPLSDSKVMISKYDPSLTVPYQVSEAAATDLASRGYEVFRTPGWQSGNVHYTYANAVLINRLALVCQFNGQTTRNQQALATFQSALPDKQIVPIDCSSIISLAGAMHCIVMHVPDVLFRNNLEG